MTDICTPSVELIRLANKNGRGVRITMLCEAQKYLCHYCNRLMQLNRKFVNQDDYATIDHIRPRCKGGKTTKENTVAACLRCNWEKAAMAYEVFRAMKR